MLLLVIEFLILWCAMMQLIAENGRVFANATRCLMACCLNLITLWPFNVSFARQQTLDLRCIIVGMKPFLDSEETIHSTDKETDESWDIFIIWKINCGLWKKSLGPIMSNFWGPFFYVFMGKKYLLKVKNVKKIWEVFFTGQNPVFLGRKISM